MKAGSGFELGVPKEAGSSWKIEPGIQDEFGFCTEQRAGYICGFLLAPALKTMCMRLWMAGPESRPRPLEGPYAPGLPWNLSAKVSCSRAPVDNPCQGISFSPLLPSRHLEPHVVRLSLLAFKVAENRASVLADSYRDS